MLGHIWLIRGLAFIMSFSVSLYFLMEFSQYLKIPFLWDPFKQNSELPKQMWEERVHTLRDIYCLYYGSLAIIKLKCGLVSSTLLF